MNQCFGSKSTPANSTNIFLPHSLTELSITYKEIYTVSQTKLLGMIVNNTLIWDANTKNLVQRANSRLRLLQKLVTFSVPVEYLINIYILYIRSIVEQSCQVWHSSLTLENVQDLERIQKNALKIILQEDYQNNGNALNLTGLKPRFERRNEVCIRFAKACVKNDQMKSVFPPNPTSFGVKTRNREKFEVVKCKTKRFQDSAIPFIQNLLNSEKYEH